VAKEYRTDGVNPAVWRHGLQPLLAKPSKVRRVVHHPAMRYAQVPAFMAELAKDSSTAARALTFTVLTGLRSPVRYAVWGEIDWKMKTKEDFECPLSDAALAILNTIKGDDEPAPNAPIFTGRFGDRLAEGGFRCVLRRICKEMGIKAPAVHGFRSSFRDFAGRQDQPSARRRRGCAGSHCRWHRGRLSTRDCAGEEAAADAALGRLPIPKRAEYHSAQTDGVRSRHGTEAIQTRSHDHRNP